MAKKKPYFIPEPFGLPFELTQTGEFRKLNDSKKRQKEEDDKLLEAFVVIADRDVNLLSYEGQTLWNRLAMKEEKKLKEVM